MWKKIENYYWTLKYLKKSQLFYLVKNRLEQRKKAVTQAKAPKTRSLSLWMQGLDEHPEYLKRFRVEEILKGNVTLLHESGRPEGKNWEHPDRSHLWNFNLHYLEFLIPLAAAYRREKAVRYYDCFRDCCIRWIQENREGTGDGWHPYTISLRLTNLWICMDGFGKILQEDREFLRKLNDSMYAQYRHLQKRMERHLLGNHYFENLKAVLLGALYFQEPEVYQRTKKRFAKEIREQILPDGVHCERSMMYHKIILEDLMRVEKAMGNRGRSMYRSDQTVHLPKLLKVMQKMADAAYSLEDGMGRTPLFNDAGDNVARPLAGILEALDEEFRIRPEYQQAFPVSGYYTLQNQDLKLVFDAGEIAPAYMPGHAHCDGLSFELSWKGKPLFVNSGTGQYQGELRSYFRSTAAHNTVVIDGEEQSQCWGEHRVGKRIRDIFGECGDKQVKGSLYTCTGKYQFRAIEWKDHTLVICDKTDGSAAGYFHLTPEYEYSVLSEQEVQVQDRAGALICRICTMHGDRILIHKNDSACSYAPEFGKTEQIQVMEILWNVRKEKHIIQLQFGNQEL